MTDFEQQNDKTGVSSGTPLDDPPDLNLEVPEDVQESPQEQSAAQPAAEEAAPPEQENPEDEILPDPALIEPGAAAPSLAERNIPGLKGNLAVDAMGAELSAFSSLDEVVANEIENRIDSSMAGLDGDNGAEPEGTAAPAEGYTGLDSDMIGEGGGLDLMTVLAGIVMREGAPADLGLTVVDSKKWRYDVNPLKQLAERGKGDVLQGSKQDNFRVNARTIVAASAAILALAATRQAQAHGHDAATPAQPKTATVKTGDVMHGGAVVQPVPAQEQAPVPMADDAAARAATRQQEEQSLQQAQRDEQSRQDAQQSAERNRQRQVEFDRVLREQQAAAMAEQARNDTNRFLMLETMELARPEAALGIAGFDTSFLPENPFSDPVLDALAGSAAAPAVDPLAVAAAPDAALAFDNPFSDPGLLAAATANPLIPDLSVGMPMTPVAAPDAGPALSGGGFSLRETGVDIAGLLSLFRDNSFSVTAPSWSIPDKPGWQTALNNTQPDLERPALQPATPAPAQTGPDLFKG